MCKPRVANMTVAKDHLVPLTLVVKGSQLATKWVQIGCKMIVSRYSYCTRNLPVTSLSAIHYSNAVYNGVHINASNFEITVNVKTNK